MRLSLLAAAVAAFMAIPGIAAAESTPHPASCSCPAATKGTSGATAQPTDSNVWANHFQTTVEAPR
jgi:hypothetical protein